MTSRPEGCPSIITSRILYYCTANFYLEFKNSVFEGKVIISFFVKNCKKFKFSESQHAALVSFAKTPQKLSLQKFSRKSIISTNFMTEKETTSQQQLVLKSVIP